MASRLVRVNPVTVNEVLDGHGSLDLECLDRVYLNAYVPNLQVGGLSGFKTRLRALTCSFRLRVRTR